MDVIQELWSEFAERGNADSWYHFVVARGREEPGKLLGFACYGQRPLTEGTYDLYWIGVDQHQQGRGIGTALLNAVEAELRDRHARLLIAETEGKASFDSTRRFYLSAGYTLEARIRDFYRRGEDLVMFTKRL